MSGITQAQHINNSRASWRKERNLKQAEVIGKVDLNPKPAADEDKVAQPIPSPREFVPVHVPSMPQHADSRVRYVDLCDILVRITPFGVSMKGETHGGHRIHAVIRMADGSERRIMCLNKSGIDIRDGCVEVTLVRDLLDGLPLVDRTVRLKLSTMVKVYTHLTSCELV